MEASVQTTATCEKTIPRARGVVGYHARLASQGELARGVRFNPGRVHFLFFT